jgi:hypothetical protein
LRLLDIRDDRSERGGVRVAETHDAVRMHVLMFARTSDIGRGGHVAWISCPYASC